MKTDNSWAWKFGNSAYVSGGISKLIKIIFEVINKVLVHHIKHVILKVLGRFYYKFFSVLISFQTNRSIVIKKHLSMILN